MLVIDIRDFNARVDNDSVSKRTENMSSNPIILRSFKKGSDIYKKKQQRMPHFKQDYTVRGPRSSPFTIMLKNLTLHVGLILIQRIGIKMRANSNSSAAYYKTSGTSTCMTHKSKPHFP